MLRFVHFFTKTNVVNDSKCAEFSAGNFYNVSNVLYLHVSNLLFIFKSIRIYLMCFFNIDDLNISDL